MDGQGQLKLDLGQFADGNDEKERSAADFLPPESERTIAALRQAASGCEGCELYKFASQTVFGRGPDQARIMFVGEQPGDVEDRSGIAFSGPAGKLLAQAMESANIPAAAVYFTNSVKHFGFQEKGKQRIHKTPRTIDIRACHPWLEAEIEAIAPDVIVCLGATAVSAVLGKGYKVTEIRGQMIKSPLAQHVMATVHPASILRGPSEDREENMEAFIQDLKKLKKFVA